MASSGEQKKRVPRQHRRGFSAFAAGAIALVVTAIVVFFGFTKDNPFSRPFEVKAVFQSAVSIRGNSAVRIAGVNVGKVKGVERYGKTDMSVVTMEIQDTGLPIKKDATMQIRPRIFLEGNFFVDIKPGTPSAPAVEDGDTIPVTNTSTPVQLDEVLTALQSDTRENLQILLKEYGGALMDEPTAEEDADQDPEVRGLTGAEALNKAAEYSPDAFRSSAIVAEALQGTAPRDLSKLIAGLGKVSAALSSRQEQLKDLLENFNTTQAALASEESNLRLGLRRLAPTLQVANTALDSVDRALPPTRAFAREILPGVRETPATIEASFPWIEQTRQLVGPDELQGVARELKPTARDLAALTDGTLRLLPEINLINRCLSRVVLPTGDVVIEDEPNLTTGVENYKEFWYAMVGLAGEGQNFDGNGNYVRFQVGGGSQTVSLGRQSASGDRLFGSAAAKPLGTRPAYPGIRPPYRPNFPCFKNKLPDLNGAAVGAPDASAPNGNGPRGLVPGLSDLLEGLVGEELLQPFTPVTGGTPLPPLTQTERSAPEAPAGDPAAPEAGTSTTPAPEAADPAVPGTPASPDLPTSPRVESEDGPSLGSEIAARLNPFGGPSAAVTP